MSYGTKFPLSKFLITPESEEDVLFNKATVFLYRVYDILSLLHQWKLSSGEQRTALDAKFQEPMDPTGKWFTGTIYEAMESPLDKGMAQVKEVKITLVDDSRDQSTRVLVEKTVDGQSITKWGHLVREMASLMGSKVLLSDLIYVIQEYETMADYGGVETIDTVATYDGLLHLYARPPYNDVDFNDGLGPAIEMGEWDIWYQVDERDL